ncbi:hypothetical protein [uncultured Bifidobacterium sp.]|uniref:hypothetical protein n=1 Tax=uncultured Bifidobacterium sp. TaxID=165187 RepID=UPI0028DBA5AA|nr:hypothetical protein [uncultured Bifidobacterium sp.]
MSAGCTSVDEIIDALRSAADGLASGVPLIAWGLEPMYFSGRRLSADDLDKVSKSRPIMVVHTSMHAVTMNHAALERDGMTSLNLAGIMKDSEGNLTGEVFEFEALGRSSLSRGLLRR